MQELSSKGPEGSVQTQNLIEIIFHVVVPISSFSRNGLTNGSLNIRFMLNESWLQIDGIQINKQVLRDSQIDPGSFMEIRMVALLPKSILKKKILYFLVFSNFALYKWKR